VTTPRDVVERLLAAAAANDPAQADLYADDGVHELPFSPAGPMRLEADQLKAMIGAASGAPRIIDQQLRDVHIYQTDDPEVVFTEFTLAGTATATGEPVQMANAMVVRVRDGKIVLSRNYLDPVALGRLTTPAA
jgi:ketosteroid isomerase-like protein